jgi:hypothetical protein
MHNCPLIFTDKTDKRGAIKDGASDLCFGCTHFGLTDLIVFCSLT